MRRSSDRSAPGSAGLEVLGIGVGEPVRWRNTSAGRWQHGVVGRRERDGSIGVTDVGGAARSIAVERLEVGCRGVRGGQVWEPLTRRASRSEQLSLLAMLDPSS